ncbi:MAG: pyruvate kinase [Bacteroidia bacterium]|nr:pyruvate kinase [Bacteroidia bacterium]
MNKETKTKIVATIGPASSSKAVLKELIERGMNICRINFSHGDYEAVKKILKNIRQLNKELGTFIGVLADLQGPKLRIGEVKNGHVELIPGTTVTITTKPCISDDKCIYITYPQFPKDVSKGENVLIADGKITLRVTGTDRNTSVKAEVVYGGTLESRKGVNLPNTKISLPCLTPKDIRDLEFALDNNIEWIGLSFVRSVTDVVDLKERIKKLKSNAKVVAKIEKPEAIEEIDNIIDMADAVMVARGDLGVELEAERVPLIQKMLVRKCIEASRPVIIATQMMESMLNSSSPTRAEVNDVSNAVLDGADAVMLSEETSVGQYPVRTVEYMHRIIKNIEENEQGIYHREHQPMLQNQTFISDSICYNACVMARQAGVKAIASMTNSGYTAFKLSSHRPKANIYIFTDNRFLLTALSLVWGVHGFYYNKYQSTDQTISDLKKFLQKAGLIVPGDFVINIASTPIMERGRTNMLKLSQVV